MYIGLEGVKSPCRLFESVINDDEFWPKLSYFTLSTIPSEEGGVGSEERVWFILL